VHVFVSRVASGDAMRLSSSASMYTAAANAQPPRRHWAAVELINISHRGYPSACVCLERPCVQRANM
jgi:hypothetical protein